MVSVVGSVTMELEQAFRSMTLELATKLSEEECHKIAYVACIDKTVPPEHGNDFRLYLLNTLESRGQIGPLKLQFLEEILVHKSIGRIDLLDLISAYKKKQVYKEAKKRRRKQNKRQDQRVDSATTSSTIQLYEETYAKFLTQYAQMALAMRSALETGEVAKMKDAFSNVAKNGDAVTRTLKKNLSLAGVNSDSMGTSSSGDSSRMVSPTSTPSLERMELPNDSHCPNDAIVEIEESPCDQCPCIESTQATAPVQLHCQPSQSQIPSNPVYVYRESPSIPQKLSQIGDPDPDDVDNTGDGTGTGDSGLGNMKSHTLSKEALDQIDPDSKKDPFFDDDDDDNADNHLIRAQQAGYTPLIIRSSNPDHSNDSGYAKPCIRSDHKKENDK